MEKVNIKKVGFLININDDDGDIVDSGIYLSFDSLFLYLKVGDTVKDLTAFIDQLEKIKEEIKESYPRLDT